MIIVRKCRLSSSRTMMSDFSSATAVYENILAVFRERALYLTCNKHVKKDEQCHTLHLL